MIRSLIRETLETLGLISSSGSNSAAIGPSSATDNAVARFDGTTGKLLQNSAATVDDTTGDITAGKYHAGASTAAAPALTGSTTTAGWHFVGGGPSGVQYVTQFSRAALDIYETGFGSTKTNASNTPRVDFVHNTVNVTCSSGTTQATSGLIPAGATVLLVTYRVTTAITGATSFDVGDGSDPDRYGDNIAVAQGTTGDETAYTADPRWWGTAAREITLTANGGDFSGGVVSVHVFYMVATPSPSN